MLYAAAPADTAAHWLKGRMLSTHFDRSQHTVFDAVKSLSDSGLFNHCEDPMKSAVHFYMLNHVSTMVGQSKDPLEPLDPLEVEVLRAYSTLGSQIAARLFWYVLLISTREARHNKSSMEDKLSMVTKKVKEEYPSVDDELVKRMFSFTKSAPDASSILSHMLVDKTKQFPLGPFCKLLSVLYYKCSWPSSYGGPKWGNIADALHAFVSGKWSAEIFADTAFTLAHNTAPIFNKGMLYNCPGGSFIQLLDAQRAGMVPNWVRQYGTGYKDKVYELCLKARPELFEADVDWHKVMSLGAVGNYHHMLPKVPPKPPVGCTGVSIQVDAALSVNVLQKRAA